MYVIIAGGGRTGAQLAKLLVDQDHDVHLIEDRKDVLAHIHKELPTESIHEGNPIDLEVLEQAGIQNAEVLAACTPGMISTCCCAISPGKNIEWGVPLHGSIIPGMPGCLMKNFMWMCS